MGCGMSTFGLVEGGVMYGFRPLRRRIDQRDKMMDATPSTKLLLKEGSTVDNNNDSNCDNGKSNCAPMIRVINSVEDRKSVSLQSVEEERVKKVVVVCDGGGIENKEGGEEKERDDEEDGEEERGERNSDFDESSVWIGSPSFREYCYNDCDSDNSVDCVGNEDGEMRESTTQPKANNVCTSEICTVPGSKARSGKKGRRGRRFRKVFPVHKPAAVKNLWNVTSCYNQNASSCRSAEKLPGKPV